MRSPFRAGMPLSFLLVDFENVRDLALSKLSPEWAVRIFVGRSQNSIPFALTTEAQALGDRLQWIKIQGDGRNNLDFHLAYHLGTLSATHPSASFFILSRDQGFDALIAHLNAKKIACTRVGAFTELPVPKPKQPPKSMPSTAKPKLPALASKPKQLVLALAHDDAELTRIRTILASIQARSKPRNRGKLTHLVATFFQGKQKRPEPEIERLVDALFAHGWVAEKEGALTYHL